MADASEKKALDALVRQKFELSWNRARDLISRGKITVDGEVVTQPTTRVSTSSALVLNLAAPKPKADSDLAKDAIVHIDAHIVIVEKPSGIATVPFDPDGMGASIAVRDSADPTLDQQVRAAVARREKARGRTGPPPDLGIVHRLDKETSGLLVFTRTFAAKKALSQLFRFHHIHRRYLALIHGAPKKDKQTIETHFVDNRGDGLRGSVEHRRGRKHAVGSEQTQKAVTHIEVIERLAGDRASLVACTLETGRTHQIRIHLSEVGHPVVGERVYIRDFAGPTINAPRVMLHAAELGFVHPATEEEVSWTSKLPKDFEATLERLRK